MKKIILIILCLCFVPVTMTYAKSEVHLEKEDRYVNQIENDVKKALIMNKNKISLKSYKIKVSDYPDLTYLTRYIPYLNKDIKLTLYAKNGYYYEIKITNLLSLSKTKKLVKNVDHKIKELVNRVNLKNSDEKNALLLHDYIVSHYEYDEKLSTNSYYLYGMLENKKGVCQSYAFLYKYILNKIGMDCYVVNSQSMNHAWNIVKIDNDYYHVDLCKDDPVKDNLGVVSHDYFLLSDGALKRKGYKKRNKSELICSNKKYDSYYFRHVHSPIVMIGNDYYYIKDRFLVLGDKKGNIKKYIEHVGYWNKDSKSYYKNSYSGLILRNFVLYFNTCEGIYTYNLLNKKVVCKFKNKGVNKIYGIRENNNMLEMCRKSSVNKSSMMTKINFLSL